MRASTASTHTLFSTGCSPYFDWQALGLAYSHRGAHASHVRECPSKLDRRRSSSNMRTSILTTAGRPSTACRTPRADNGSRRTCARMLLRAAVVG